MQHLGKAVARFLRREDGPTAVEYAVMLALIIVVCIVAIATIGSTTNGTYRRVGSSVNLSS
jgi:pilus assembly protein Flp/PilA